MTHWKMRQYKFSREATKMPKLHAGPAAAQRSSCQFHRERREKSLCRLKIGRKKIISTPWPGLLFCGFGEPSRLPINASEESSRRRRRRKKPVASVGADRVVRQFMGEREGRRRWERYSVVGIYYGFYNLALQSWGVVLWEIYINLLH